MAKLDFPVDNKIISLEFSQNSTKWCNMYLTDDATNTFLGATTLDRIRDGFLSSFRLCENRKYFSYQGKVLFTIVSLMETRTVIAARELDDFALELNFLDRDGNIYITITLKKEDIISWTVKFESI